MRARTVAVKICGLTKRADAEMAEASGASYLGVILAGGPRLVSIEQAGQVLGPRRASVRRVGVFGHQTPTEIARMADVLDLDIIQLHGDLSVAEVSHLQAGTQREIWPVLRIDGQVLPPDAGTRAEATGALVLDAQVVGQLGGTGVSLDWPALADDVTALRARVPGLLLVLAGGLRPENVEKAIHLLEPSVVDVSSGVESAPGVKDPALVQRFLSAAGHAAGMLR